MDVRFFEDIRQFDRLAAPLLLGREQQYTLLLEGLRRGRETGAEGYIMAAVIQEEEPRLIALYRPPYNLLAAGADSRSVPEAAALMGTAFAGRTRDIPGVMGEAEISRSLAEGYAAALGKKARLGLRMTLMRLDRIGSPDHRPGRLRPAREADLYFLPHWRTAYRRDCGMQAESLAAAELTVREQLRAGRLFLWEADTPKAMAAIGRVQDVGASVSGVYTPPALRGQGFATACVSAVCRKLLEEGHSACLLYADEKNPVSNHIYSKIGFIPLCGSAEYRIVDL